MADIYLFVNIFQAAAATLGKIKVNAFAAEQTN